MFPIGRTVQTAGINNKCQNDPMFAINIQNAFRRYLNKDWGDLCDDDKKMNDEALETGDQILASYNIPQSAEKIYIITEYDRSVTTVLFANEY
jgi:hypothetical protein